MDSTPLFLAPVDASAEGDVTETPAAEATTPVAKPDYTHLFSDRG
ncbi:MULTISPECIES: hypothetical protein [Nocardiaceae]|nr:MULTISPECIES: hypothetical protein [Rhodococcus]AMY20925.1 hypothetical protein A3Q40_03567 [Rhodococcus sp. PBTS 1]